MSSFDMNNKQELEEWNEWEENGEDNREESGESRKFLQGAEGRDNVYQVESWEDENLNLKNNLIRGIYSAGYEVPSSIQKKACYPMIYGKKNPTEEDKKGEEICDLIGQAQSGTGKTGCFVTSTLQIINEKKDITQCLIMAPTRELAQQINKNVLSLGQYMKVRTSLLIGGEPVNENRISLEKNPQIVIGTPGRVLDCFRRGYLNNKEINLLILDEADEMLSSGFKEQIYNIFEFLPRDVRVGLFSATMPLEVEQLTEKFLRNPIKILVKKDMLTLEGIAQWHVKLSSDGSKYDTLKDIFENLVINSSIIYCNSVDRCEDLYSTMKNDGFPVQVIHAKLSQEERVQTHQDFINGKCRVLIATDIYARGIDVQQVQFVVNFDIPHSPHTYLHRIGRSGRWGRKGIAINFVNRQDMRRIREIESYYHTEIREMPNNYTEHLD